MGQFIQHTEPVKGIDCDQVREKRIPLASAVSLRSVGLSASEGEKVSPCYEKEKTLAMTPEILGRYGYEEEMGGAKGDIGGLFGM